ncbi:hypothetical protein [Anaeromyxobacter paludicola]|uniref:Uncharacterized protein n=1 Tax=Anaeromyxobacter paludicola TaxID=2918171 RepID=A0ABN6N3G1_9BACT|nr:hypothetical protein [Anaeromyxobacter paludicola]BDG07736.1 hypothetical protein AMPC_08490 [Anaeromyxobacter paludicola]
MSLQELQEKLLGWATAEPRKEWLLASRAEYFGRYGEPHEEDKSFESRMNGMLDAYLYDFHPDGGEERTIERFLASQGAVLGPEELAAYRDLARNVHALFEVRRIKPGEIRLREVFSAGDYDVAERRQLVGLAKGDLIEARLLPFEGKLVFSGAFIYHPQAARKRVLAEVKRLKKIAAREGQPVDPTAFLARLSRMAFKLERYRNVKLESIYDFEAPARTGS